MAAYVGVDVSKGYLDAAAVAEGGGASAGRFPNTAEGIAELVGFVAGVGPRLAAVESTGAYHRGALAALAAAGLPVALVNPAQVKAFRQTLMGRNKTDRQDALLLARFARAHEGELRAYEPRPEERERLKALVRYREALTKTRVQLLGQLEAASHWGDEGAAAMLGANLAEVGRWIAEADERIGACVAAVPEARVLTGLTGVGTTTAAAVLAYLPEGVLGDAKAAACYAGVHPAIEASGRAYTSRMSKRGCAPLRRYLYLAAMAAIRYDPELRAFYERLLGRGKARKQALAAAMHKLLRRMIGTLRAYRAAAPQRA